MALGKMGIALLSGATLAGGLALGSVAFDDSGAVDAVKADLNTMNQRIVNLDTSKSNYKTALEALQLDAQAQIDQANKSISDKNSKIGVLKAKVSELTESVTGSTGEKEELTAEITRLEGEVTKANEAMVSLKAEASTIEAKTAGKGTEVETAEAGTISGVVDGSTVYNKLSSTSQGYFTRAGITGISEMSFADGVLTVKADKGTPSESIDADIWTRARVDFNTALGNPSGTVMTKIVVLEHDGTLQKEYNKVV